MDAEGDLAASRSRGAGEAEHYFQRVISERCPGQLRKHRLSGSSTVCRPAIPLTLLGQRTYPERAVFHGRR
jgi:hypothetical protein